VWHIEVLPRLAVAAGFEFATGMAINSVLPELAAETLRNVTIG
jgi:UDPglucose--hexose-1-phosphate uridylyltransferase